MCHSTYTTFAHSDISELQIKFNFALQSMDIKIWNIMERLVFCRSLEDHWLVFFLLRSNQLPFVPLSLT